VSDESTHATWVDPLTYDFLRNGPPYLPEGERGTRMASLSVEVDIFSQLVRDYQALPMAELGVLVSILRAASIVHQGHHWQTRGGNFYGDHLLFERLYNDSLGFIDQIAERAVGSGSRDLVCPKTQLRQASDLAQLWCSTPEEPTSFDMVGVSLRIEQDVLGALKAARLSLESKGLLTDGTDNLIQGVADKHEEFVYLLQQRWGGRTAGYSYSRVPSQAGGGIR
jgi:DNA-binding ferritin-like protein